MVNNYNAKNGDTTRIDLEKLVGKSVYSTVTKAERFANVYESVLRGNVISWYAPNKRTLWQSFGQEYIEPELIDFIDNIPSDGILFDVGASIGNFGVYAAIIGKSVYCFEPEGTNFSILNINAYLNRKKINGKLKIFNLALSDRMRLAEIGITNFEAGAHEKYLISGKISVEPLYRQNILTITLDEFCNIAEVEPTDIKIDVDGSALHVLNGMEKILNGQKLKRIFIEVLETNENDISALKMLERYGFREPYQKKYQVQNYINLYNYILKRD